MSPKKQRSRSPSRPAAAEVAPPQSVEAILAALEQLATQETKAGMARYAIPSDHALGVTVAELKRLAKAIGRQHRLAGELWQTGVYEARMLAAFIDEPERVTAAQMDRWRRDFDNWAIVDTVSFHLFDRTSHAWSKVEPWSRGEGEFQKRSAFALLWALSLHDKTAGDALFASGLALIERAATDERNFVKKAVNMALRAIGRRSPALHSLALAVSQRLAASSDATATWIGKDALKELQSAKGKPKAAAADRRTSAKGKPKR